MSITYRSNFEELVATSLKLKEYETDRIKYIKPASKHTYTPDFKLKDNVYFETKGRFTASDRKKHLLLKEQHPELTIVLVFQNAYNTLTRRSSTTYADWATKNGILWFDWRTQQKELQSFLFDTQLKRHKAPSSLKAPSAPKKSK